MKTANSSPSSALTGIGDAPQGYRPFRPSFVVAMADFWKRFLSSLRIRRAPILDPEDIRRQEQQARIDQLYPRNK